MLSTINYIISMSYLIRHQLLDDPCIIFQLRRPPSDQESGVLLGGDSAGVPQHNLCSVRALRPAALAHTVLM